jgi:predicted alpha-1,2-mannosidase
MKSLQFSLLLLFVCSATAIAQQKASVARYVNPFIGTDDMGHCFPGAAVPFGMVQLSPETDTVQYSYGKGYNPEVYRYCSGYQYADSTIVGFSHTHFNGTGHSDLGDILVMPTVGELKLNPGTREKEGDGYRSRFSHRTEEAHPGYYAVTLQTYGIRAELTTTTHVGLHRYRFPQSSSAHIILDLTSGIYNYDGKTVWSFVRVENDTLITGYRQTNGWARTRYIYFAMAFSKPITSYSLRNDEQLVYKGFWRKWNENENFPERAGRRVKGYFNFETREGEEVLVKCAISGVSTEGALKNLASEAPGWDFDRVRARATQQWEKELSKIQIRADEDRKVNFYTAMYHACLSPIVFSDVDGKYRGLDQNIHQSTKTNYTIFSLWDTYRALHPLFTLIQPERESDMVNSLLQHYEQSVHKILPVWSHYANDNWCMIGYHSVSVMADACVKGLRGFDAREALKACVASASYDRYDGIGDYRKRGFVPEDLNSNSASKTLEYAYDDWAIAQLAAKLGEKAIAHEFQKRAASYVNIFDSSTGFMRAKNSDGSWRSPFDPLSTLGQGYIEGNAWNYSLYVPHDVAGFIHLLGGKEKLVSWLDTLFTMTVPEKYFQESEDVTRVGVIGNYVHGNEPSHHVPYLYCFAGQPWKTQERIHQIIDTMYRSKPNGLCGNDDCGQMSAWYVFSCLGFYPVCPGSPEYVIGSPCVQEATVEVGNGRRLRITAENFSPTNVYVRKCRLNGKPMKNCFITHEQLLEGGDLTFTMSARPNTGWMTADDEAPYSLSRSPLPE